MIRFAILAVVCTIVIWAPWMDRKKSEALVQTILTAYGDMPATCYDVDGAVIQEGVSVRWYPMGRMVHTCSGDFVLWFWGDVKELGGISKKATDIQVTRSKALTCEDVLKRQEARRATSTDNELVRYDGPIAQEPVFSIFPDAERARAVITGALRGGATFAGRFAVAEWECGQNCAWHAVVDVETGQVVAYGPQTEFGVEYSLDSTLLITNPVSRMPALPENPYEVESLALSLARVQRSYYRLTYDVLSNTRYLVSQCVENATTGYIEVEDDRIGVVEG